eukprot:SAG31_NODE_34981_length_327_cov_0.912281_1_plen_23_part_10
MSDDAIPTLTAAPDPHHGPPQTA